MATFTRRAAAFAVLAVCTVGIQPLIAGTASAAALGVPGNLAPDSTGGSPTDPTQVQKDPILSWNPVPNAGAYRVQIARTTNWTDSSVLVSLPDSGATSVPRFVVPQMLSHGDYFWRVRAENGSTAGAWSPAAELFRGWFDAPADGPAPGSDATVDWRTDPNGVTTAPFRLSWTAIPDASSYEFELSTQKTFPQPGSVQSGKTIDGTVTVVCITTHTTFTPYGSVSNKDSNVDACDLSKFDPGFDPFYWRVRGLDDSSTKAPTNDQTQSTECFGVPGDPTVDTTVDRTDIALGTPSTPAQECSRWSAPVLTQYPASGTGAFNSDQIVSGPNASLSCTSCTDMPEIQWSPYSPDGGTTFAGEYDVTIADDPDFTNVERSYDTRLLTLTPRDQLAENTAGNGYWVSVQACTSDDSNVVPVNNQGCGQPTVLHFTKQTPQVTGLTTAPVPNGVQFSWSDLLGAYPASSRTTAGGPAVEAMEYRVELARTTDAEFAQPLHTFTVDRSCATQFAGSCYQPGVSSAPGLAEVVAHVADGSYLWRVVPVDVAGNHLQGSAPQGVTVDTTAPAFRLTDGSGHADNAPLHIRASESGVIGVNASSLTVHSLTGGGAVAGTLTPTSATTWTFTPTRLLVPGERYGLGVTSAVHDGAGNQAVVAGSPVRVSGRIDDKNRAWRFSSGWKHVSSSSASGGTFARGVSGATATVKVVGSSVSVYGCKAPRLGKMRVSVDGVVRTTRSLAQSFTSCGVLVWKGSVSSNAVHTLKVAAVSGAVDLDRAVVS